jgi:hypothetical protein
MFGDGGIRPFGGRGARRWLALGLGVVIAGSVAGAVVAGQFDDGSQLSAAIEESELVKVADIPSSDGAPAKGVYVQLTRTGHLCVWESVSARSRERGGGCNTVDDPLNGQALSFTLSYDGGPAVADVRTATLFGLATPQVARAAVLMSDQSRRDVRLRDVRIGETDYRAFGYRLKRTDLKKGIGPIAVIALDASGAEIGRQTTGIG